MAASEKSEAKPRNWAPSDREAAAPVISRDRRPTVLNRDIRIIEEFAFRHPEGGNAQDFIAAAKATGHPFKSEATIRTIQNVLIRDGVLLKDGRNQFRAPPEVIAQVRAGKRTPLLEKFSRSQEWEQRREWIRSELRRIYPPPARFRAVDVFRRLPELRTIQNAYAYLRSFEKRSQILSFGEGLFGFEDDREPVPAQAPNPPVVAFKTVNPEHIAERLLDLYEDHIIPPPFRPRDLIRPLPAYALTIFGTALEPPLPPCIVLGSTEHQEPQTPATRDIEVMWLDPETGHVRVEAVHSWMFEYYKRPSAETT